MARTPIDMRPAVAQWLIRARASRGDAYTAARFLDELRAATGSAPDRATYAQWESGAVTPKEASLAPVVAFWAERGIAAPQPDKPVLSYEERHLALLAEANTIADRQATAAEQHVVLLAAILDRMTTPSGEPRVAPEMVRDAQEWAAQVLAQSPLPRHAPVARSE